MKSVLSFDSIDKKLHSAYIIADYVPFLHQHFISAVFHCNFLYTLLLPFAIFCLYPFLYISHFRPNFYKVLPI